MAVVHFQDFDIPIVTQPLGRIPHERGQHGNAKRRVAGLDDGDFACSVIDQIVMPLLQAGGADQDRRARRDAGIERVLQRLWRGEIHQHVRRLGQAAGVPAVIDPARQRHVIAAGNGLRDGLAHAPCAADDADGGAAHDPMVLQASLGAAGALARRVWVLSVGFLLSPPDSMI